MNKVEELIVNNMKLVTKIASDFKIKGSSLMIEDLISAGNVGLMEAANKYDENKGGKFSVFASYYIKSKIREEIYKFENAFSIGRSAVERMTKINRLKREKVHEMAEEIGMKNRFKINSLLEGYQQVSIDDFCNDEEKQTVGEIIPDKNNCFESMEKQEIIDMIKKNYKSLLTEKERQIFELFFFSDRKYKQKEIASMLETSLQNVNHLLKSSIEKIKRMACLQEI